jgi:thioredoxin 1
MSDVVFVDDSNFEAEVLNSTVPVLVDFGATWCGPCKRQLPIIEKFAADYNGSLKVVKIDIDDAPLVTAKLGIRSVPTLILFSGGGVIGSKVGLTSLAEMHSFVLTKTGS